MTVYVLMLEYDCEPSSVRGVYLTLEKAKAAREAFMAEENTSGDLAIYPVEVDSAPTPIGDWIQEVRL